MKNNHKLNRVNFSEYSDSLIRKTLIQTNLCNRQTNFAAVSAFATSAHYS